MADLNVSKKMALMAVDALEDRKGEDVRVIDISEISTLADYFIISVSNCCNSALNISLLNDHADSSLYVPHIIYSSELLLQ